MALQKIYGSAFQILGFEKLPELPKINIHQFGSASPKTTKVRKSKQVAGNLLKSYPKVTHILKSYLNTYAKKIPR